MKKIKKILAGISAVLMSVSISSTVASAEWELDKMLDNTVNVVNPDKLIFSTRKYIKENDIDSYVDPRRDYVELWIDEDYHVNHAYFYRTQAVVKMADNSEPPLPEGVDYPYIHKLNKAQIESLNEGLYCGKYEELTDLNAKPTDNVYMVYNLWTTSNTETYCKKLLDEGLADYAKPVTSCLWSTALPDTCELSNVLVHFKEHGIDSTGFAEDKYTFYIEFENESDAKSFNADSITGFAENLSAITTFGKKVYFQFKSEANGKKAVDILNEIQKMDNIITVFATSYEILQGGGGTIDCLPNYYEQGDINRNNVVDLYDAIAVAEYLVNKTKLDNVQKYLADFDENDKIDLYDAIGIAETLL